MIKKKIFWMGQGKINKHILLASIALVLVILVFRFSEIDILIQDFLFRRENLTWILDRNNKILYFIFYSGIKKLLILFFMVVVAIFILSFKSKKIRKYRKGLFIVILTSILSPLIVGGLKDVSNVPCPRHIEHYGGHYPEVKIFDKYPSDFGKNNKRVRCWPAGHASAGFSLLSLIFLFNSRRSKVASFIFAMFVGWSMGLYKMLIGDHFLSHTIVTMLIIWLIILANVKFVDFLSSKFPKFNYLT